MANNFMGKDGFYWWQGVVEDRNDPLMIGRCKVRILGVHTDDKSENGIPTKGLPWAQMVVSVNNETVYPPKEGSWVMGFFRDGDMCQDPVILFIIPGINEEQTPNHNKGIQSHKGFYDPVGSAAGNDMLTHRPVNIGAGFEQESKLLDNTVKRNSVSEMTAMLSNTYPKADKIGEPDTHRLARHEDLDNTILKWKRKNRVINVVSNHAVEGGTVDTKYWSEPDPIETYNAKYPYNKVTESESGHVFEIDDTLGHERIHTFHRSGTFDEMLPNGDRVMKTFGNSYRITYLDDHYVCFGTKHETFGGNKVDQFYRGKQAIIGGDNGTICHNNNTTTVGNTDQKYVGKAQYLTVEKGNSNTLTEAGSILLTANGGNVHIKTDKEINLTATKDVKILALENINTQAAKDQTHIANRNFQVISSQSIQIDAGALVQIQSGLNATFHSQASTWIGSTIINIDAMATVNIRSAMCFINCMPPIPTIIVDIPGTPVPPATGAEHAAKGDSNTPSPSSLGKK